MGRGGNLLAFAVLALVIGLAIAWIADLPWWIGIGLAALSLTINGWLAWREDRGSFNE
ncbi:hypothetical protein [Aurantiacibacter luteus]|uniref:hypothetical protein n=1 Tax=Aurantiacibacter luteus TaxID=1581420 RepID=UPI000ADA57FD|nr:hypothetical protein [Aurantiacibacter luteus]